MALRRRPCSRSISRRAATYTIRRPQACSPRPSGDALIGAPDTTEHDEAHRSNSSSASARIRIGPRASPPSRKWRSLPRAQRFRTCAGEQPRYLAAVSVVKGRRSDIVGQLSEVVRKGLVGIGHPMRILPPLHRADESHRGSSSSRPYRGSAENNSFSSSFVRTGPYRFRPRDCWRRRGARPRAAPPLYFPTGRGN